ncbi:RecQ2B, partial [Brachionus plicatilis]
MNGKSQFLHPFFDIKNETVKSENLEFEQEDEKDFCKASNKNLHQPEKSNNSQKQSPPNFLKNIKNEISPIEKIQPSESSIDHKEFCPSCKCKYTNGANRRLIDACGHGACFCCIMKQEKCVVCEKTMIKETGLSRNEKECILETPKKEMPDIIPDSPIIMSSRKNNVSSNSDDEQLDDLKPLKVKSGFKEFENAEKISKQFRKDERKINNDIEVFDIDQDFSSLNNTSTQIPIDKKDSSRHFKEFNGEINDEDDEDYCVIEDFEFDSTDSGNKNDQMSNSK